MTIKSTIHYIEHLTECGHSPSAWVTPPLGIESPPVLDDDSHEKIPWDEAWIIGLS